MTGSARDWFLGVLNQTAVSLFPSQFTGLCFWSSKSHPLEMERWEKNPHLARSYTNLSPVNSILVRYLRSCARDEVMETENCLSFSSPPNRITPENSPGLEHNSGSFFPCDDLQKSPHLPLAHRHEFFMGRYADGGSADFTHGVSTTDPRASPGKHTKYLENMNQDQKTSSITEKNSSFYETNSDGKW